METYGLEQYGITGIKEIVYNPTYEELFKAEMDPSLEGFEKGPVSYTHLTLPTILLV